MAEAAKDDCAFSQLSGDCAAELVADPLNGGTETSEENCIDGPTPTKGEKLLGDVILFKIETKFYLFWI